MNFLIFLCWSCSYDPHWENHTLYAGKTLIWRNLVHLRPFFGQNWLFLEFLTYNFPTPLWIFLIFWYGNCCYGLLWENHTLYAGKILIWRNLVLLRPFFGQNWQFWEFLTYNFQNPLWIFLFFGMEVVLMVLFEKIILYMPGKFWYGEFLAMK